MNTADLDWLKWQTDLVPHAEAILAELNSRGAAIQHVRTQATETLRLCREAGVPESSAHLSPQAVLRALDRPEP